MKINLAIYTATEGFDWQPSSAYTRGELNKYKEMIGRFPDILMEKVPYGGIFVCDGRLVFYRFHIALRWDSRGRDALYCVLGTIPLEAGKKVNLNRVFETPEFCAPMRPFPNSVEIEESLPARPPSTWEEMQDALNSPTSSAQVGVLASFFGHGKFFCRLDGSVDNPTYKLTYENCDLKPAPKVEVRPPIEVACAEMAAKPNTATTERNTYDWVHSDFEKRLKAKEADNQKIKSENQRLKNIVVILAVILGVLVVASVGALLFSCCFPSPQKSVQGEKPKVRTLADLIPDNDVRQPGEKSSNCGKCDKKDYGQGQKFSEVVDNLKPAEKRVEVVQKAFVEQVDYYVPPNTVQKLPSNEAIKKESICGQVTSSSETNNLSVKGVMNGREVANRQEIDSAHEKQVRHHGVAICPICNGRGVDMITVGCTACGGTGYRWYCQYCRDFRRDVACDPFGFYYCTECRTGSIVKYRCERCGGSGMLLKKEKCSRCDGRGRVKR